MTSLSPLNSASATIEEEAAVSFALTELLKGAGAKPPRLKVEGVNADSRAILPGEAFFAVPGLHTHGDAHAAPLFLSPTDPERARRHGRTRGG